MKLLYIGDKQISVKDGWDQVNKRNQVVVERLFAKVTYIPLDNISFIISISVLPTKLYQRHYLNLRKVMTMFLFVNRCVVVSVK